MASQGGCGQVPGLRAGAEPAIMGAMRLRTAAALGSIPLLLPAIASGCSDREALNPGPTGGASSSSASSSSGAGGAGGSGVDPRSFYYPPAPSCAYDCSALAARARRTRRPYVCPTLGPWANIPHAATCAAWDGTYPAPVEGRVHRDRAHGRGAEADAAPIPTTPRRIVLPDGRRLHPAGVECAPRRRARRAHEPASSTCPGTPYVVTVDTGYGDHIVRAIDVDAARGRAWIPVASDVKLRGPRDARTGGSPLAGHARVRRERRRRRSTRSTSTPRPARSRATTRRAIALPRARAATSTSRASRRRRTARSSW